MCYKNKLHLPVLYFPPLIIRTSPGGGAIGLLQTVVAAAVCSVPGRDTVASGAAEAGMVADVGGVLQITVGAASQIMSC